MVSIDVLPDDVLLAIFDFVLEKDVDPISLKAISSKKKIEAWQPLVHVCRRWRCVIFGSSHRLDLRLICTPETPARDTLDVWPAFPLHIQCHGPEYRGDLDNIIAVLERSDRVHGIDLWRIPLEFPSSHWEKLSATMQVPFPDLTRLDLWAIGEVVLPDSFLGGSAPSLRHLWLNAISFLGLPKLLLSATHLVHLYLERIPHSGYFSPKAMGTALSALTRLDRLILYFQSPLSRSDRASRLLPPRTRSVLSALTDFFFKGDNEYLDDLVAHIDAPRLNKLHIVFFNDILFDTPQLMRFIYRTPTLKRLEKACVTFGDSFGWVELSSLTSGGSSLRVGISCGELDWQVLLVHQVFTSSLPPLSTLEDLYIREDPYLSLPQQRQHNTENSLWLELLLLFRTVKNLYISKESAQRIRPALQELVGIMATEVLPTLQNIFLQGHEPSGPVQEGIREFVAMRQVISDPIVVSSWNGRDRRY
jgi:hypothetical protein